MLNLYSLKFAYQLISRMDPSEVRYFKRFSGFHGGDKFYLDLFDRLLALRKQRLSPNQIRPILQKEDPKLEHLVKHLNERLLEALTFYYETNSPEHRLSKTLRRTELLLYKGLLPLLPKMLLRVYHQALQEERFAQALQAVDLLKQLWGMNLIRGKGLRAEDLFRYTERVLQYLNHAHKAWYMAAMYAELILEEGESHPRERLLVIDQYASHLNLEPPHPSDPLTLHFFYDTGQALRARLYGQTQQYLDTTRLLVYKMEQRPKKLRFLQSKYLLALNNLLAGLTEQKHFEEAWQTLEKLRNIVPTSRYLALQKERLLIFNELNLSFLQGRSDAVAARYEEYLERLEKTYLRSSPSYAISSYYLLAFNLLTAGRLSQTLQVLQRVEQGALELKRRDLLLAAFILRLLTAVQTQDPDLLRKNLRAIYRKLRSLPRSSELEKAFLSYLRQVLSGQFPTQEAALDAFARYLQEVRSQGSHALQRFWEVYFPIEWLEKKLQEYAHYTRTASSGRSRPGQ
ncbi:MAG: hypothetical protein KatS3mg026_0820 [Bacteroidia bacterium]|nr:MAG: hypothetical protein KatS3mg026_0820 [Bacteroidia bacterium]